MTLIQLLIVVAIVGLLAKIAAVGMVSAIEGGRQRRTMGDMHPPLPPAVHAYHNDFSLFPVADGYVSLIQHSAEPAYLQALPSRDGWAQLLLSCGDGARYTVLSFAGDRTATPVLPVPHHRHRSRRRVPRPCLHPVAGRDAAVRRGWVARVGVRAARRASSDARRHPAG